jgi:signal transduction histidine kinase
MDADGSPRSPQAFLLRRLAELRRQSNLNRERMEAVMADTRRLMAERSTIRERRTELSAGTLQALLEAKAVAERASDAKSQLLTSVVHDLRQPLQVIIGAAAMLERHVPEAERRHLERIDGAAQRIDRALGLLLEARRIETVGLAPSVVPLRLGDLLREIEDQHRPAAEAKGLRLCIMPTAAAVLSDPKWLASNHENLVGNAVKYTERGRVLVGGRRQAGALRIEVHDTGRGIPADEIGTIFEPFRRLDPAQDSGVGLGLAIVRRQAEVLGHHLAVRSTVGKGSCFAVTVPLAKGEEHGTDGK